MVWVYRRYYDATEPYHVIEQVLEELNDMEMLADLYPEAIYFYAELTTEL